MFGEALGAEEEVGEPVGSSVGDTVSQKARMSALLRPSKKINHIESLHVGMRVGEADGITVKVGDADGALTTTGSYLSPNTANTSVNVSIESTPTSHLWLPVFIIQSTAMSIS